MLIRFIISNYLSFKEESEFNSISGSFKTHKNHLTNVQGLPILNTAAIYGANGAGKSNLVRGLRYLQKLIKHGSKDLKEDITPRKFKLDSSFDTKPTKFEIEFVANTIIYNYGIVINNNIIEEEWLFRLTPGKKNYAIFERQTLVNGKCQLKFNFSDKTSLKDTKEKLRLEILQEELRANQPFIYEGFNRGYQEVLNAYRWFDKQLVILKPHASQQGLALSFAQNEKFKELINFFLQKTSTGISEIGFQTMDFDSFFGKNEPVKNFFKQNLTSDKPQEIPGPDGPINIFLNPEGKPMIAKLFTSHITSQGSSINFEIKEESDGTRRLIDLIPSFIDIIENGKVYVIDELDRSLHPSLLKKLVELFLEVNSANKGQLIFTTHEEYLLDLSLFRQDEIWFIEKDENDGASKAYSLADFKPRYDRDIRKGYLQGKFGAIPFIGNLQDLNW